MCHPIKSLFVAIGLSAIVQATVCAYNVLESSLVPPVLELKVSQTDANGDVTLEWFASDQYIFDEYSIQPQFSVDPTAPVDPWNELFETRERSGNREWLVRTPLANTREFYRLEVTDNTIVPSEEEIEALLEGRHLLGYDFLPGNRFEIPFFHGSWFYMRDIENQQGTIVLTYDRHEGQNGEPGEPQAYQEEIVLDFSDTLTATITKRSTLFSRNDGSRIALEEETMPSQSLRSVVEEVDLIPGYVEEPDPLQSFIDQMVGLKIVRNPLGEATTLADYEGDLFVDSTEVPPADPDAEFTPTPSEDIYNEILEAFPVEDIASGGVSIGDYRSFENIANDFELKFDKTTIRKTQETNSASTRTPPVIEGWWEYVPEVNEQNIDDPFYTAIDVTFTYSILLPDIVDYEEKMRFIYLESDFGTPETREQYNQIVQRNRGELVYSADLGDRYRRSYPETSENGIVFDPNTSVFVDQEVIKERLTYVFLGENDPETQALVDSGEADIIFEREALTPDDPATSSLEGQDFYTLLAGQTIGTLTFIPVEATTRGNNPLSQEPPETFNLATGSEADAVDTVLATDPNPSLYLKLNAATNFRVGHRVMLTNNASGRDIEFDVVGVFISPTTSAPFRFGYVQLSPVEDYTPLPQDDVRAGSSGSDGASLVLVNAPGDNSNTNLRVRDTQGLPGNLDINRVGDLEYYRLDRKTAYFVVNFDLSTLEQKRRTMKVAFDTETSGSYESYLWEDGAVVASDTGTFAFDKSIAPSAEEFFNLLDVTALTNIDGDQFRGRRFLNVNYITRQTSFGTTDIFDLDIEETGTDDRSEPRRFEALGLSGYWIYKRTGTNEARIYLVDTLENADFSDPTGEAFRIEYHLDFSDPTNASYEIYQIYQEEQLRPIFVDSGTTNLDTDILPIRFAPTQQQMESLVFLMEDSGDVFSEYSWNFSGQGARVGDGNIEYLFSGGAALDAFSLYESDERYDLTGYDISQIKALAIRPNGSNIIVNRVPTPITSVPDSVTTITELESFIEDFIAPRNPFGRILINGISSDGNTYLDIEGIEGNSVQGFGLYTAEPQPNFDALVSASSDPVSLTFLLPVDETDSLTYVKISYTTAEGPKEAFIDLRGREQGITVANAIRSNGQLTALEFESGNPDKDVIYNADTEELTIVGGTGVLSYSAEESELVSLAAIPLIAETASYKYATNEPEYDPEFGEGSLHSTDINDFTSGVWRVRPRTLSTIDVEMYYAFNDYLEQGSLSYWERLNFNFVNTNYFFLNTDVFITNSMSEDFSLEGDEGDLTEILSTRPDLIRDFVLIDAAGN